MDHVLGREREIRTQDRPVYLCLNAVFPTDPSLSSLGEEGTHEHSEDVLTLQKD